MNEKQYAVTLHAPDIRPKIRHVRILETFDRLKSGEVMHLSNTHDPKLLYYQFLIEREGSFHWEYVEEGPELWRVEIEKR
ncbi:DUF2249 domain-containing protein [Oceanobacillus sp. FSL K6-2867]|uniref:Uncharacterized protein (DUF2249 family) n=1 Tax=Oceanobacillus polygoni TaxID=1235259 RepID=A0A9X1CL30_9BACI|nr:DUF2249 domain-containing protein [Oceanobacillus polygoni]MBP2079858.1 uncharacterized protein (DUF2249 family) [Oceanobacillus polygoni]